MLWDFKANNYHEWVANENITSKFPTVMSSNHVTVVDNIKIGVGLHDSSAALIPYLKTFHDPFVLISTGTWCISLNPFNQNPLTREELESDCLQYISFEGKPVKASRLFTGHEHDLMLKKIASHFNVDMESINTLQFDRKIAADSTVRHKEADIRFNKTGQTSSGFSQRNLFHFRTANEAYHQLMIDIVRLQAKSTNLVLENTSIRNIYVDGGFNKNPIFMNLLAAALPSYEVFGSSVPQASAIGAAMAIHSSWNDQTFPNELIELRHYARADGLSL
jgi:sugar (pentulose or hexulose) kinase